MENLFQLKFDKTSAIIIFLIALAISTIFTFLIIKFSNKYSIYDRNGDIKNHTDHISRLGGFAIFIGFIIPFLSSLISKAPDFCNPGYLTSSILLAFMIGFMDDLFNLRMRYKLLLQIICGILVVMAGVHIKGIAILSSFNINFNYFSYPITIFFVVVFMNAINLIDGIDGLSSGTVLISLFFITTISIINNNNFLAFMSIILAGAIIGFYIFNFPPARIYMGDGGAYFLGIMLAIIALTSVKKTAILTTALVPILLLLIPLSDILHVMKTRLKKGTGIFKADKNHIHHILIQIGLTPRRILAVLYSATILLGVASLLMIHLTLEQSIILFCILAGNYTILFYLITAARETILKKNESSKNTNRVNPLKLVSVNRNKIYSRPN